MATIDGSAKVIAHLSSEVDKFVMADNEALTRFVADELVYGLDQASRPGLSPVMAPVRT